MKGPVPRFSHDEARSLRRQGWLVRELAERYGVTCAHISKLCRGVTPCQRALAENPRRFKPGPEPLSGEIWSRVQAILDAGSSVSEAARRVGLCKETVRRARLRGDIDVTTASRGCRGRSAAEVLAEQTLVQKLVPAWAQAAGLTSDYLDFRQEFGEQYAARVCRRLSAEAQRPC